MARIYLRLPQCSSIQEMLTLRQWLVLSCGLIAIIFLVVVFIHSRYQHDLASKSNPHFLPTVNTKSDKTFFSYGPNVRYGIVLDCGSSGTRVYVYIWPPHSGNPRDLLNIQQLKDQYNTPVVKKVSPGLDTFGNHPEDASEYIRPLLEFAASHIPKQQHKETLLYILATAGMRLLPEEQQKSILSDLQKDIPKQFDFVIADNNFEVISGKQEGVYAWIAANYALQKFGHGEEETQCQVLGFPQFESDWMLLSAHVPPAELRIPHGLGQVPAVVDVLVKAIDGPNEGFIFRAEGNTERDDDSSNPYGGVVYLYNAETVRVMTPYYMNHNKVGASLYTGSAPHWVGDNMQTSNRVMVRVRCWIEELLPPTCFKLTNITMRAGSSMLSASDTFQELNHGYAGYPSMVKVRTLLTNSIDMGWYSDGQGAAKVNFDNMWNFVRTGGLKYAYNNETVRIWASSAPYGYLETHVDGWGNDRVYVGYSDTGIVEVRAWCYLAAMFQYRVPFGQNVSSELFEMPVDLNSWPIETIQMSIMVEAADGPNQGYLFESAGNGYTYPDTSGSPCTFGGVLSAYSTSAVRYWRPDDPNGGAICIPSHMGDGTYAQSSNDGVLVVTIWRHPTMHIAEYEPMRMVCNKFTLLHNNTAYSGDPLEEQQYLSTIALCDETCRQYESCIAYEYHGTNCKVFNATDDVTLYNSVTGAQIWGLEERSVTIVG